jgi:iron complex outermembrane receptor protein
MKMKTLAFVLAALSYSGSAQTEGLSAATADSVTTMDSVTVEASADASAKGLLPAYAGGQVARGGRIGVLGTHEVMNTPFSITSYTNALIQDRQVHGVADVLQNHPSVRVARGYGNFQESFFIRGFLLSSEDIAYNGLYGLMPRQYIATELFERVDVLCGAPAFLTGATPTGGGIGGTLNLVPKRALSEPLTRVTVGLTGKQSQTAVDVSRRFGVDDRLGLRFNVAHRGGGSAIDDDYARTSVAALGLDWHSSNIRLSGDIGWQDNRLRSPRPSVTLGAGVTAVPVAPKASGNFVQKWTYSNERDVFGTLRGEID